MANQSSAIEIPHRWPLLNPLQTRSSSVPITQDARLINCYAELDPTDKEYWIYKRVGLSTTPFIATQGVAGGIYTYAGTANNPQILSVMGTNLYATIIGGFPIERIETNLVGAVGGVGQYYFEVINTNPQVIVLSNGQYAYIYAANGGGGLTSLSAVAGYPAGTVPGWAYLDGTLYVMDSKGNIWGSGINDLTIWSGTNVIVASAQADQGVALARQLAYVVAFKQWTTQIFYDAGNATGSPLGTVPEAQVPYGCWNGYTVQSIDDVLFWVTFNKTNSLQIGMMENLQFRLISTPSIDRLLTQATFTAYITNQIYGGISSFSMKIAGHRFYGITIVNLNITLVYDIDQKLWYIWSDVNGNYWPISGMAYIPTYQLNTSPFSVGSILAQHNNGNVYMLDGAYTYPTDYGNVFPMDIYTPNFDGGTARRKMLKTLYPIGDKIPGGVLQMRYSDNDYQSWSNFRSCDMGLDKPRFKDCGTFHKRRALHFRHQQATSFRIKAVDMQMELGTL